MKNKRIIQILLLLTIFSTTIVHVQASDSPILQVSAKNIYLKAGQENAIKIILKNTGDYNIYDVEAFLSSSTTGLTVISEANKVVTEIRADKSRNYEPTIYVDQSLALGAYTLSLTVTYGRSGSVSEDSLTVPIGVYVSEAFRPSLVYSPTLEDIEVKAGATNDVSFMFSNIDNETITDVNVVLSSSISSITITENVVMSINEIASGDSFSVNPKLSIIEGTTLGVYSITAGVSYKDTDGNRFHQMFSLPVNVASSAAVRNTRVTIEEIEVLEGTILPGDIFTVELTIKCSGAAAYELLGTLNFASNSPVSPVSPSVISLGDLDADETSKATYSLLASGSIEAGQYLVTAIISYTNSRGTIQSVTETITLLVDGLVDFRLLDTESIMVYPGTTDEFEADILLIGTESVEFVSISLEENAVFKRVQGSEEYIGAIDPDSPIPFDLLYKVDENTEPGTHQMTLLIKYRDHLNKPHETLLNVDVEISAGTVPENGEESNGGFWNWLRNLFR
ncbi:hypothetical protein DRO31_03680 [Candidatus Bathyarchaeota archaeon]|nr:MAG: hypothetical protein DRO31_03680 [Candidatus Bathyarchaeota archaeon]